MTWGGRLLYGLGELGMMVQVRFFFMWILAFAAFSVDGQPLFSASAVGAVLLAFRIFDGVTDPVAGIVSDGWVRRGRERRSLLWFSFAIPSVGLILTFLPNHSMSPALRWLLLCSGMFVFFVGYTFYAIPYWSLVADYSQGDVPERRILSTILGAGLLLAVAVGAVLSPQIIGTQSRYLSGAIWFAIPAAALTFLPYFGAPPPNAAYQATQTRASVPLRQMLVRAFRHKRFVAVLFIFAGSQMSFSVMTAAAPFIAQELLGGTKKDVTLIMAPFLGTAIPFFIAVPWFSRRFGWQKAIVGATFALGVVYACTGALGEAWVGSRMTTAMLVFGLGGPMAAILLGIQGEAITACAAEQEEDATSIYFGVFNFLIKSLNGVAALITGVLIDLSRNPAYGKTAIRFMGLTAGGLLFIGCIAYLVLNRPSARPGRPG